MILQLYNDWYTNGDIEIFKGVLEGLFNGLGDEIELDMRLEKFERSYKCWFDGYNFYIFYDGRWNLRVIYTSFEDYIFKTFGTKPFYLGVLI